MDLSATHEKLRAVEFTALPEPVRQAHWVAPLLSVPLRPEGEGFAPLDPAALDRPAPTTLLPKLAIKSWRDSGGLGLIYEGASMLTVVGKLLAHPTAQQRTVARAWLDAGEPLHLHLLPFVDLVDVSEARFLAHVRETRLVSACQRGSSARGFGAALPQMLALARSLTAHLPTRSHVLDLALLPTGQVRVIEVNPGLTPQDLGLLRQASAPA